MEPEELGALVMIEGVRVSNFFETGIKRPTMTDKIQDLGSPVKTRNHQANSG